MSGVYVLVGICVGIVTLGAVFLKLAFQMGQMAQQLHSVVEAIHAITEQIEKLFEWRYQDAIRDQKRR